MLKMLSWNVWNSTTCAFIFICVLRLRIVELLILSHLHRCRPLTWKPHGHTPKGASLQDVGLKLVALELAVGCLALPSETRRQNGEDLTGCLPLSLSPVSLRLSSSHLCLVGLKFWAGQRQHGGRGGATCCLRSAYARALNIMQLYVSLNELIIVHVPSHSARCTVSFSTMADLPEECHVAPLIDYRCSWVLPILTSTVATVSLRKPAKSWQDKSASPSKGKVKRKKTDSPSPR